MSAQNSYLKIVTYTTMACYIFTTMLVHSSHQMQAIEREVKRLPRYHHRIDTLHLTLKTNCLDRHPGSNNTPVRKSNRLVLFRVPVSLKEDTRQLVSQRTASVACHKKRRSTAKVFQ